MGNVTILKLIQKLVKSTLVVLTVCLCVIFSCFQYYSFKTKVNDVEKLVIRHVESLAINKGMSFDYLSIQQELTRFLGSIEATLNNDVSVEIRTQERLLASEGALKQSYFPLTHIIRTVKLPNGDQMQVMLKMKNDRIIWNSIFGLLSIFLCCFVILTILLRRIKTSISQVSDPLFRTIEWLENLSSNMPSSLHLESKIDNKNILELVSLNSTVNRFVEEIRALETKLADMTFNKAKLEIADLVAHDIRSPLATLALGIRQSNEISAEQKRGFETSMFRITSVLEDLSNISLQKEGLSPVTSGSRETQPVLLSKVFDEIISEKRLQYVDRREINFESNKVESVLDDLPYCHPEIYRALSNVIDNAVEAIQSTGTVSLTLSQDKTDAYVVVADSGMGIPKDIISALGTKGNSFGKEKGCGLGLYQTKLAMDHCGGSLKIDSEVGRGTTVALRFPKSTDESGICDLIEIKKGQTIIVVDDDESIRTQWRQKASNLDFPVMIFNSPEELTEEHKVNLPTDALFVVDFEFNGSSIDGIGLIENLQIENQSVLISGKWDFPEVKLRCKYFGIKRYPKERLHELPIRIVAC